MQRLEDIEVLLLFILKDLSDPEMSVRQLSESAQHLLSKWQPLVDETIREGEGIESTPPMPSASGRTGSG